MAFVRKSSLAVAVSVALVACTSAPSAPPASQEPPAKTSEAPVSTPAVPNIERAEPARPRSIKVGVIEPLTGPLATHGIDNTDGFNFYLASVNHAIADRSIEPVLVDSGANVATALAKAKELVEGEHVDLLMGLDTASECLAVAEYANRQRQPLAITGNCGIQNLPAGQFTTRFTYTPSGEVDSAADWAAKNGFRKAILIATDGRRGIETSDAFASAFIARGGQIVQELHPPRGTADFGPYVAQLNRAADIAVVFLPGANAGYFGEQYLSAHKLPILDLFGHMTTGATLSRLGDKAVGVVSVSSYIDNFDAPGNRQFVRAWRAKYGDRPVTSDVAAGYVAGQVLEAAVEQIAGKVQDSDALLQALYYTDVETVKGRVRLDGDRDVVQSTYVYRLAKQGRGYANQLLQTYTDVGRTWDRTPQQLASFQFGGYRGTWVGMTKAQLGDVVTHRDLYQYFGPSEIR